MLIKLKFDSGLKLSYFGYLFPRLPGEDIYKVSTREPMGSLLVAHILTTDRPPEPPDGELVAVLDIPLNAATQNLANKFIYYSQASTAALMMALGATFDIDFAGYYRKGTNLGYGRRDIVEAFILSRNLVQIDNRDTLYKRIYRSNRLQMKEVTKRLLRRCYYLDECIDLSGLKDETTDIP
ncbi:MAG: hypothetical protein PUH35_02885 [Bacteroidales bacterium]|uniref:hypothetical protein n=1 Tax=Candidatus Cryptobacteroides sp. TaxID=2952915 RepID=UPI002A765FB9|nr:hypothetical protein [Candidatus Cryptobacteroides sp.]MDD7234421.1 hypothetical protein [Bacteroidales bacterium]MDY2702036.1 hypothetical protein [Candidatus Cryptobacteroides sp.]